jgi:5-methyltetrahydropteroyltriglutamate--homocysteine methyltransferase
MSIPTEPIGSIPRPARLLETIAAFRAGSADESLLKDAYSEALRDTIERFEQTGSPVISDGEQTKPSFATYPLAGLTNLAPDGVTISFADARSFIKEARRYSSLPMKQAVISPSALSLLYPAQGIPDYHHDAFLRDLIDEAASDIRGALDAGAANVQIDFTEGRLSLKLDPSGALLRSFVALNNQVLERFSPEDRQHIGVHVCPGGDFGSTHSADVDYALFLPDLFQLNVGRFYLQLASEPERKPILGLLSQLIRPHHLVFVGVINPITATVETPAQVRDRVLEAAAYLPIEQLGTTDDCGFSPFADDTSTARDIAFKKIQARVEGTQIAAKEIGL